jgi:hypothetical protein
MAKTSISIGLDDETGQPPSAPEGPYTTDRTEDSRKRPAPRGTRARNAPAGGSTPAPSRPADDEDLASRRKGPAQP